MKKKWLISSFLVLVCAGSLLFAFHSSKDKNSTDKNEVASSKNEQVSSSGKVTINTLKEAPNKVTIPKKANVFIIKNNRIQLKSDDELTVKVGDFSDKLDKDTRFILVPDDRALTEQEKTQLQKWVNEKKMVLFFGTNVDANLALKNLNVDKEVITPQSEVKFYYFAYGYGHSYQYNAKIPLFLMANSTDSSLLNDNLHRFLYEYRGF